MKLFRRVILILLCVAIALGWGRYTFNPGKCLWRSEMTIQIPSDDSLSASKETLQRQKTLMESEEFRTQAAHRIADLHIQRARQHGPEQLVKNIEGSKASFVESLANTYSVRLDEVSHSLVLTVTGESHAFVNSIFEVVPDLLVKIYRSNAVISLGILADEIQLVLMDMEQQERNLAQVLWNLKGILNAKFADRPISKRGSIPPPSSANQASASLPSSVTDSLVFVRAKLTKRLDQKGLQLTDGLPSFVNAWNLLKEALFLKGEIASLVQQASSYSSLLDSATSMERGPLPESLAQMDQVLLDLRRRREMLAEQARQNVFIVNEAILGKEQLVLTERMPFKNCYVVGLDPQKHYLMWGLRGLGMGIALFLISSLKALTKRTRE